MKTLSGSPVMIADVAPHGLRLLILDGRRRPKALQHQSRILSAIDRHAQSDSGRRRPNAQLAALNYLSIEIASLQGRSLGVGDKKRSTHRRAGRRDTDSEFAGGQSLLELAGDSDYHRVVDDAGKPVADLRSSKPEVIEFCESGILFTPCRGADLCRGFERSSI